EGSLDRLLPPPSAHEPQHPRRLVHRLPVRRAQLPDRTPPVPRDAARFAAQGRPDDPRILRGQEGGLHRGEHPGVLRDARRLPQPGWTRRARSLRLPARRPVAHGAIAPRASCRERGLSLGPVTGAEPPAENGAKLYETRFCRPYTVLGGEPERPRALRVAWSNARHPRSVSAPHRVPHG